MSGAARREAYVNEVIRECMRLRSLDHRNRLLRYIANLGADGFDFSPDPSARGEFEAIYGGHDAPLGGGCSLTIAMT